MSTTGKQYDIHEVEARWYAWCLEHNVFHSDASRGGEPYCIVMPPPNITGILHMGHALNNTLQDILIRWRRMQGRNVVWMPGTDHAGIATQNVVERALRKEGKTRADLGRERFVERVWQWREQYGGTIVRQLKRLGASCDWQRERFTMDAGLSRAVEEVFVRLYEKGLIYRANYIINWCPRCQTALSDEESEHQETAGKLYYLRYPCKAAGTGPGYVVVATTRPETLLGDVAVAVHPEDQRYRELLGQVLLLPILRRELPVIADTFVDPQFGTGAVKVTPAHDPNDFLMGQRHGLTPVNVMHDDGTMNAEAGPYAGLDRFECRRRILRDLEAAGLLERVEDHVHAVGHCYRCDTVVEPRLSWQWFVRMQPLAAPAIAAVREGRVRFIPERWTKVYLDWMENIRDWCISRQIWWGHRIPVFYCDGCGHTWAARGRPAVCARCGGGPVRQDEDVLDTWFSSWLWPFSTFGWPEDNADLRFYYPTNTLVTASEIIFFWVARMIMAGLEFMGDVPFREVVIHGTVRDDTGRKMSKSLGNAIDPVEVIEQYGADALRFSLMMITPTGQDIFVSLDKFEIGRNFATKLWNAARYLQQHTDTDRATRDRTEPAGWDPALLNADDRHLLAKLSATVTACTENLERFRFNDTARDLYEFVWHQFCDWYLEASKAVLAGPRDARRQQVVEIMDHTFAHMLRLLHPFMPFVTDELWHVLGYGGDEETIANAPWPKPLPEELLARLGVTPDIVGYVEAKHDMIRAGRMLRADYGIAPGLRIEYVFKPLTGQVAAWLAADAEAIKTFLRAKEFRIDADYVPGRAVPSLLTELGTLFMPIAGLIDVEAERNRLGQELARVAADLQRVDQKLANTNFVTKAPGEVVRQQQARRQELAEKQAKLAHLLEMLSTG